MSPAFDRQVPDICSHPVSHTHGRMGGRTSGFGGAPAHWVSRWIISGGEVAPWIAQPAPPAHQAYRDSVTVSVCKQRQCQVYRDSVKYTETVSSIQRQRQAAPIRLYRGLSTNLVTICVERVLKPFAYTDWIGLKSRGQPVHPHCLSTHACYRASIHTVCMLCRS